jgi:hypothetical protein
VFAPIAGVAAPPRESRRDGRSAAQRRADPRDPRAHARRRRAGAGRARFPLPDGRARGRRGDARRQGPRGGAERQRGPLARRGRVGGAGVGLGPAGRDRARDASGGRDAARRQAPVGHPTAVPRGRHALARREHTRHSRRSGRGDRRRLLVFGYDGEENARSGARGARNHRSAHRRVQPPLRRAPARRRGQPRPPLSPSARARARRPRSLQGHQRSLRPRRRRPRAPGVRDRPPRDAAPSARRIGACSRRPRNSRRRRTS